ncbi:MAG: T9SS type A sorting domain-containing protein, partial [Flavobacteriales bacterium]|nr:T9SS type A sorting domain-containing protein [Flavobacteriales bacterium]
IDVSQPNNYTDGDPSNNPTVAFNVQTATQNTHTDVTVQIITDAYGSETTWDITDANGAVVLSGGPYSNLSTAGTTTETPVSGTLNAQTCHTFTIYDSYGDGIDAGYGAGSFTVTDGNGTILASGGQFTDVDGDAFKTGDATTVGVNDFTSNLSVYPNPVKDVLTIEGNYTSVDIIDVYGKLVLSSESTKNINVKSLADGVYMLNIKTENGIAVKKITITK